LKCSVPQPVVSGGASIISTPHTQKTQPMYQYRPASTMAKAYLMNIKILMSRSTYLICCKENIATEY